MQRQNVSLEAGAKKEGRRNRLRARIRNSYQLTVDSVLRRIVLASASPRRLELLRSLGLEVETVPSGYGEPSLPGVTPLHLAIAHAREKLSAVAARTPADATIVAADTVVDLDGTPLGKPADAQAADGMLRSLSGRSHLVHTAFALATPRSGWIEEAATTRVTFYALSDREIATYVATGEPFDKAGAYGIQGGAAALIEKIDGDFYAVMGLPLGRLIRRLQQLGFSLPNAKATPP